MYYVLRIMYYVLLTMYYALCTLYNVLYTMYNVLCIMYYVESTSYKDRHGYKKYCTNRKNNSIIVHSSGLRFLQIRIRIEQRPVFEKTCCAVHLPP